MTVLSFANLHDVFECTVIAISLAASNVAAVVLNEVVINLLVPSLCETETI